MGSTAAPDVLEGALGLVVGGAVVAASVVTVELGPTRGASALPRLGSGATVVVGALLLVSTSEGTTVVVVDVVVELVLAGRVAATSSSSVVLEAA